MLEKGSVADSALRRKANINIWEKMARFVSALTTPAQCSQIFDPHGV